MVKADRIILHKPSVDACAKVSAILKLEVKSCVFNNMARSLIKVVKIGSLM